MNLMYLLAHFKYLSFILATEKKMVLEVVIYILVTKIKMETGIIQKI